MKSKKIYILLPLVLISFLGFGQETTSEKTNEKVKIMAQKTDAMMKESLKLTEEQIPHVSVINLDFSKKMVALMEKPGSMFGKRSEFQKNSKDRNAKLKKVLTPKQMELFEDDVEDKIRKVMRKTMKKDS